MTVTTAPTAPFVKAADASENPVVIALIPAHNEAAYIASAVKSLLGQTRTPDRVVVVADNCTDDTAALAIAAGAEVFVTQANTGKKAGALNQAIARFGGSATHLVAQDADTTLVATWIEDALTSLVNTPGAGAISGRYTAREGTTLLATLQKIEYEQCHRRVSRNKGKVDVLSGTATMFSMSVLNGLQRERGYIYDENSLTEDFELTMALRAAGYRPRSFKHLITITDVMETWSDLMSQRVRWQRGTLQVLGDYGLHRFTLKLWLGQVFIYSMTLIYALTFLAWGVVIYVGFNSIEPIWLLLIPLFMLAQVVETRRLGFKCAFIAGSLIPLWFYDMFRLRVYWTALVRNLSRAERVWTD